MKKIKNYFVSLFLIMVLVLAGCGQPSTTETPNPPTSGDTTPKVEEKKTEPVELTVYSWRPEDKEAYEKFIAQFEKNNEDIKVSFQTFKSTEYNTILSNALTSGTGPDIVQLRPYTGATSIADAGYLAPLEGFAGVSDIPEAYLDAARGSDGKVYGVPLSINNALIFYNKQIFEDAGLQVPETWEELLAACETLLGKGYVPIAQAGKAAYLLSIMHDVVGASAYVGSDFEQKLLAGETNFKDSAYIESIKRVNQLEKYFPKDFIAIDDKDAQALFYTGKAAMYINGSYRLETFEKNNPDLPIDIIPAIGAEKGNTPITTWVDGSYGMVKASKHPEAAQKFMEFLASKEFGQMFSDELNRVSAISGTQPKHPLVKKMTDLTENNQKPYLMLVHFSEGTPTTKTTFENALQGMYIDQLTEDGVADETQKSADTWFKPKN